MKQCRGIVIAAWLAAMAGSAAAADAYDPQGAAPTAEPYVQSGLYFRGDAGWSWLEADDDNADLFTFGAGVGFQWSPMFRTDVRFDYGIETDRDVEYADKFGTLTANGYIDIPLDFMITPYVAPASATGSSAPTSMTRTGSRRRSWADSPLTSASSLRSMSAIASAPLPSMAAFSPMTMPATTR